MKFRVVFFIFVGVIFLMVLNGCKSEFERIRTSNDPVLLLDQANKYYDNGKYMNAQTLYDIAIPYYRGKSEAEELFYRYAYTYYHLEDYILAAHYFKNFAGSFVNSSKKEEAAYMSAYSEYLMSPIPALDQTYTTKAIESLQFFINTYPNSDKVENCNKLLDELRLKLEEKSFSEGMLYFKTKQYVSSVTSFENMLNDFPESKKAEEVRYLVVQASYLYAINSIYDKREERLQEAKNKYNVFIKKYPKSRFSSKINKIGLEIEKLLNNYKNGKGHQS